MGRETTTNFTNESLENITLENSKNRGGELTNDRKVSKVLRIENTTIFYLLKMRESFSSPTPF